MSINQDLANTPLPKRQELIVYLTSPSWQHQLRRFGDIVYFSRQLGYCILYVDQDQVETALANLSALDFVKSVQKSNSDTINLTPAHIAEQITALAREADRKLQEKDTESLL